MKRIYQGPHVVNAMRCLENGNEPAAISWIERDLGEEGVEFNPVPGTLKIVRPYEGCGYVIEYTENGGDEMPTEPDYKRLYYNLAMRILAADAAFSAGATATSKVYLETCRKIILTVDLDNDVVNAKQEIHVA